MKRYKKQMFKALLLSFFVLFGLVIFQNCAPAKQQEVIESSSTGLVSTSSVVTSGRCGTSLNSCSAGNFSNMADSTTHSWWRCTGSGGGTSISCSTPITASGPITGVCSTSLNSCLQGDVLDTADSSTHYLWTCRGINSGSSVNCRVARPTNPNAVSGQCAINNNFCNSGTPFDLPDTSTEYRWECQGANGGITTACAQVIALAPVTGACSPSGESCTSGDFEDLADSNVRFLWRCRGRNGGATNSCEIAKPTCAISNNNPNNAPASVYFGDNYTYSVRATAGSLPSRINVRLIGTRANTNGSGSVTDTSPDTATDFNIAAGGNITRSFSAAADAGIYVRGAKVYDPATSKELCITTNTTTHNLLPLCNLSSSVASVNLSETIVFNAVFPAQGHSELGAAPSSVVWYSMRVASGTTTAVPDEFNNTTMSVSSFPRSFTAGTANTQYVGTYSRYFVARDSLNRPVCRSNSIAFEITAMPPPPTNPQSTDQTSGGSTGTGGQSTNNGSSGSSGESSGDSGGGSGGGGGGTQQQNLLN